MDFYCIVCDTKKLTRDDNISNYKVIDKEANKDKGIVIECPVCSTHHYVDKDNNADLSIKITETKTIKELVSKE